MNRIDLSNLPKRKDGKIDWQKCDNIPVNFVYKNIEDSLIVIKHIDQDYVLVSYKDEKYELNKISLVRCSLGKLFNFAVSNNYKYNINDIIDCNYGRLEILNCTRIKRAKGYNVKCLICGYKFTIQEGNLNKGDGCSVCSHHKTLKGFNDLWTTSSEIAENLTNPEEGYLYSKFSNKKLDFTCNKCKTHVGMKIISNVANYGFSCPACGDGISYPNKLLYNLLMSLDINFDREIKFDWCLYPSFSNTSINSYGIYDFVLWDYKTIIEMDSGLGHGNNTYSNSIVSSEELLYKDNQKTKLAIENGYNIIRIDCQYYDMSKRSSICKDSIIKHLSNILDLSKIDWEELDRKCQNSSLISTCTLYNQGYKIVEIKDKLKLCESTIIDYLHKGNELKLVNYF